MKVQPFSVPARSEIPGLPKQGPVDVSAVESMLKARDDALTSVVHVLQGSFTPGDNMQCELRSMTVSHGTTYTISLNKVSEPVGVLVVYNDLFDYAQVAWKRTDVKEIEVKLSFASAPSGTVKVTLWIF
jgi:hypothetical protein